MEVFYEFGLWGVLAMRARNIKPGFYRDAELADCSIHARYIVPGLWMMADREGRLKDSPKQIKMELCPCDDIDVDAALNELVAAHHIIRYEAGGVKVIQVCNFIEHQNPHKNESASTLPSKDGELDTLREHSSNYQSTPADILNPDSLNPEIKSRAKSKRFRPPTLEEVTEYCNQRNNGINPTKFIAHYQSKNWMIGKNKMVDWKSAVITWEERDKDKSRASPQPTTYAQAKDAERREIFRLYQEVKNGDAENDTKRINQA